VEGTCVATSSFQIAEVRADSAGTQVPYTGQPDDTRETPVPAAFTELKQPRRGAQNVRHGA